MTRILPEAALHLTPIFRKLERTEAYARRQSRRHNPRRYRRDRQEQRA